VTLNAFDVFLSTTSKLQRSEQSNHKAEEHPYVKGFSYSAVFPQTSETPNWVKCLRERGPSAASYDVTPVLISLKFSASSERQKTGIVKSMGKSWNCKTDE